MATHYSLRIATDGLKCLVDAQNPKCYSGSGTTLNDISENLGNGTIAGAPAFNNTGIKYWTFSADTHHITMDSVFVSASITVGGWVYPTTTGPGPADTGRILTRDRSDYWLLGQHLTNTIEWSVVTDSGLAQTFGSILFTQNVWNFVVCTYDGSTGDKAMYMNDTDVNTSTVGTTATAIGNGSTRPIIFNNNCEDGGAQNSYGFVGRQAFGFIYDRALSAAEVNQNFEATRSRFGI